MERNTRARNVNIPVPKFALHYLQMLAAKQFTNLRDDFKTEKLECSV